MIRKELQKVIAGVDLTLEESRRLMIQLMSGAVNHSQIASLLTALKIKGETAEEIAGFALAMREKSVKVAVKTDDIVDVCGTGGDNSGTFNISTASAFVIAGAGIRVAKHGNRSVSSSSGSADVLSELNININLNPEDSARALDEIGIAFLFAPNHHPAMKHVAPVRKDLAMKTVFNILGPLTNPAGTKRQMIGTYEDKIAEIMAESVKWLDMTKVCFICTENKYDEILLSGKINLFEYTAGEGINKRSLTARDFNLQEVDPAEISGGSPSQNAKILTEILSDKKKEAPYFVTIANAAMGLYAADYSSDLRTCVDAARAAIDSGKAYEKLMQLKQFGEKS